MDVKGWRWEECRGGCEGVENGKSEGVGVKGWRWEECRGGCEGVEMGRVQGWV